MNSNEETKYAPQLQEAVLAAFFKALGNLHNYGQSQMTFDDFLLVVLGEMDKVMSRDYPDGLSV